MDAVQIRDLRIGDAIVEPDGELVVTNLILGETVARVRYLFDGSSFQRELRPRDVVLRERREQVALRATA